MAKVIKYKFLSAEVNHGTEAEPNIEQIVFDVEIVCKTQSDYEANLIIAKREAMGEITVEGEFDEVPNSNQEERIAELEEALNMLLNGVTE
jgi:hypothetical protein